MSKKQGIVEFLANMEKGTLYVYLLVCIGCAIAMLVNMVMQNVGFSALSGGNADEQKLLILTLAVVTVCALAVGVLILAIMRKQEKSKYVKSSQKGKRK